MRPEVQVLPGPLESVFEEVRVPKPVLVVVASALAAAAAAALRRRQLAADAAELWREATSDASH
jgi:hypothetical protein